MAASLFSGCSTQAQVQTTPTGAQNAAAKQRPNILLIVTDDQGAQTGGLGTPNLSTPNMDGIAQRGMLFPNAFCSYPSCSPSRASMLTGAYPQTTRVRINVPEYFGANPPAGFLQTIASPHWKPLQVPASVTTLPKLLDGAGYYTGISHKFHVIPTANFPFSQWISGNSASLRKFIADAGEKPFFLMHNISAPHRPSLLHINRSKKKLVDPATLKLPPILPDTPEARLDWAEYLTSIEIADDEVGQALDMLRASGKESNTIVIFTGDHGPAFQRGKASAYPLGMAVPLIMSGPGIKAGVVTKELASLVDLTPTILDFAGVPNPSTVQGISLRGVLEQKPGAKGHEVIVGTHEGYPTPTSFKERAAFDGRYHYIRRTNLGSSRDINADNFDPIPWGNRSYNATVKAKAQFPVQYQLMLEWAQGTKIEQLFDMSNDPWALNDVVKDPKYKAALETMRKSLDRWQNATGNNEMPRSTALQSESGLPPVDDLKLLPSAKPATAQTATAQTATALPVETIAGWKPSGFAKISLNAGVLRVVSSGPDPFFVADALPEATGPFTIEMRMRSDIDAKGQIYWSTREKPAFTAGQKVKFTVKADREWHDYTVKIPGKKIGNVRIDPGKKRGEAAFEVIRLLDAQNQVVKAWSFKSER